MNFYEELGLLPSASLAEIKQSYKTLCRLLHPDRQQKASSKRLAEYQMRRLNQLLEVLSDPIRRRRYDQSVGINIDPGTASQPIMVALPRVPSETQATGIIWVAAALAGFALIYVLVQEDVHTSRAEKHLENPKLANASVVSGSGNVQEIAELRKQLDALQQRLTKLEGRANGTTKATARSDAAR